MDIKTVPTAPPTYVEVTELPSVGEQNTIYLVIPTDDESSSEAFIYFNERWCTCDTTIGIYSDVFNDYQESVAETVAEMQSVIDEQSAKIVELEEAVFPIEQTSFEMLITSLMAVDLDLYDANDEIVPNMGLSTEYWEEPFELVYQNEVRKGTYYLKNADGYALGKPNGEIQPLVCEGGTVNLGNVEVIMLAPEKGGKK